MKFDFHTHHLRCGHATDQIEDYILAAIDHGIDVIGISDHSPFFGSHKDQENPRIAMAKSEFPNYIAEVLRLKETYHNKIEVLLGVESDFLPKHSELYRSIFAKYPFDYLIGSVHISNGKNIFVRSRWNGLTEAQCVREKEDYYKLIQQSALSGMFDILGHIDAMKSYYPQFSDIQTSAVDDTLKIIAKCDVTIEINTSGRIKDCALWHPTDEILERALKYGVKVTFGSDAHKPGRVGDDWELVRKRLKEIGYKEWAIFRKRKRILIPI